MSLRLGGQTEGMFEVRGYEKNITANTGTTVLLQQLLEKSTLYNNNPFSVFPPPQTHRHTFLQSNLIKRHSTKSKSIPQQYLKWHEWAPKVHQFSSQTEVGLLALGINQLSHKQ